jgi:hypothetical protein
MGALVGLFVLLMLVGVYFLPTLVGADRKVPNLASVAVINFFLGWTLVGWVVALAMAVRTVGHRDAPVPVGDSLGSLQPVAEQKELDDPLLGGIQKLGDLHERGVLTDDEFTSAKARLIGISD